MTELLAEFSPSAYMTDTQVSRLKRIPDFTSFHATEPWNSYCQQTAERVKTAEAQSVQLHFEAASVTSLFSAW